MHRQYTPNAVILEPGLPEAVLAGLSRAGFRSSEQRALGIGAGIE